MSAVAPSSSEHTDPPRSSPTALLRRVLAVPAIGIAIGAGMGLLLVLTGTGYDYQPATAAPEGGRQTPSVRDPRW